MTDICKNSKLSKSYTPHCLRATAIQAMNDLGFSSRHIIFMSGHRCEASLKSYSRNPSAQQKKHLAPPFPRSLNPTVHIGPLIYLNQQLSYTPLSSRSLNRCPSCPIRFPVEVLLWPIWATRTKTTCLLYFRLDHFKGVHSTFHWINRNKSINWIESIHISVMAALNLLKEVHQSKVLLFHFNLII